MDGYYSRLTVHSSGAEGREDANSSFSLQVPVEAFILCRPVLS